MEISNYSVFLKESKKMTNFEHTLSLIQKKLNRIVIDPYTKIWVQGNNSNNGISICFTCFKKDGSYDLKFFKSKNFRNVKQEEHSEEETINIVNDHINSFRTILNQIIR